ncbi:MAG: hypothetical protein ACLFNM_00255 [Candidatus Woesearchaeota archaeon]
MKKLFLVLCIAIFVISLSSNVLADEFCLGPVSSSSDYLVNLDEGECSSGFLPVDVQDATTLDEAILLSEGFETGCCCDGTQPKSFGEDSTQIFKKYCEAASQSADEEYEFKSLGDSLTCDVVCNPTSQDNYHDVSGYIFANLVNNPDLAGNEVVSLEGAMIIEGSISSPVEADDEGFYHINEVPGIMDGQNEFEIIASTDGTFVYDEVLYQCTSLTHTQSLHEDAKLNFTLDCLYKREVCNPVWNYSDWSDCKEVAGAWIQNRTVWRENQTCDNNENKPSEVQTCAPQTTSSQCGDNQLQATGEQCEIVDGEPFFVDPRGESEDPLDNLSCNLFSQFSQDDDGEVACSGCAYDFSNCLPNCDGICTLSDCENCPSDCENNIYVCGGECVENKPIFLNTPLFSEQDLTKNVFSIYSAQNRLPEENQTGIWYEQGTNNVELRWKIQDACKSDVVSYEVMMCEESGSEGHCGGTSYTQQISGSDLFSSPNDVYTYTFENKLKPETSYCYNVCLEDDAGNIRCAFEDEEKLPCFNTGVEYCMTSHVGGKNCLETTSGTYAPQSCKNDEGLVNLSLFGQECDADETCVETSTDVGAECKPKAPCVACNGFFGLFGHYDLDVMYDGKKTSCSDLVYLEGSGPDVSNGEGLCYIDSPFATQKVYSTCNNIQTCYDYTNKDSCEVDSCYKFTDEENHDSGCEWSVIDDDLKTGVCRPTNVTQQDCFLADDSVTGYADELVCQAYGENCYFNQRGLFADTNEEDTDKEKIVAKDILGISRDTYYSNCIDKEDMGCFFYDTKEDCVGKLSLAKNSSFDILYANDEAVLGTNKQLQESNDYFNYTTCQWIQTGDTSQEGYCVKNTNEQLERVTKDDCRSSSDELCYTDNSAPRTKLVLNTNQNSNNLPTYSLQTLENLDYTISDNVFSDKGLKLYASLIPITTDSLSCRNLLVEHQEDLTQEENTPPDDEVNSEYDLSQRQQTQTDSPTHDDAQSSQMPILQRAQDCVDEGYQLYPIQSFDDLVDDLQEQNEESAVEQGEYLLLYYAQDDAQNKEELNTAKIYLDTQNPDLDISYELYSQQILQGDIYRSILEYNFTISEPSTCELQVSNQEMGSPNNWHYFFEQTSEESIQIQNLEDGLYQAKLSCTDEAGNTVENTTSITIDGDISITNPSPHADFFSSIDDVDEFSIVTQQPGNCTFDQEKITTQGQYSFDQSSQNSDGTYTHTASVPLTLTNDNTYVHYYTSCDFEDDTITQNQEADSINFVIDKEGPQVTLYHKDVVYEDDDFNEEYPEIDDSPPQIYHDNSESVHWADERTFVVNCTDKPEVVHAGCKMIRYCVGSGLALGDEFNPSTYCLESSSPVSFSDEEEYTKLATFNAQQYSNKHLHVWAEDELGNTGEVVSVNMRLRKTTFDEPTIILTTIGDTNEGL